MGLIFILYTIINDLAEVPLIGVLIEVYSGTSNKNNNTLEQISHSTSKYGQSYP